MVSFIHYSMEEQEGGQDRGGGCLDKDVCAVCGSGCYLAWSAFWLQAYTV